MSRCHGNWRRRRDGQALVELALVVPVLILMIVGLAEFARAWNTKQVLTDAAREGLRNSVVANPAFTYQSLLDGIDQSLRRASLDPERAEVSVEGWRGGSGTRARISIEYQYELGVFGAVAGWAVGDRTLVLSTSFVMRNE
ncbi:MAG TPA: TadE family protein [Longimicrobiales bacterium]|nr:TadE family protein [Longimicrobiales bacterium]